MYTGPCRTDRRGEGDQLTTLLKPYFAVGAVDGEALKRVVEATHLGNTASQLSHVSPASIAAGGGAVETFRLAEGVSLYLDAVSALKALPANARAAGLAAQCGYGDVPLFGDMYVGRMDGATGRNVDFTLAGVCLCACTNVQVPAGTHHTCTTSAYMRVVATSTGLG